MSYTRSYTAWADYPQTTTPITASKMQNIDDGVYTLGYSVFDVTSYGAVANGVADDTAGVNAAIAALNAAGKGILHFPGMCNVSSALTPITVPCVVRGAAKALCGITATVNNIDILTLQYGWSTVRDLDIAGGGSTSGAALVIDNPGHQLVKCRNVTFNGTYAGVRIVDNSNTTEISGCYFYFNSQYGIWRPYAGVNGDGGDDFISNNFFNGSGVAAIRFDAHGGPKIIGNKIVGAYTTGVDVQVADGVSTSIMSVVGNSFDGPTTSIRLGRSGTTGAWSAFTITGNLFTGYTGNAISIGSGISYLRVSANVQDGYDGTYDQITSPATISASAESLANTVITATSSTFDGITPYKIEFFSPRITPGVGGTVIISLYDGSTSIGTFGFIGVDTSAHLVRRFTPSAGSHTYSVRAWIQTSNGTIGAGNGTINNNPPAFLRIVPDPILT